MERQFQEFAGDAARFSRQIMGITVPSKRDGSRMAASNLGIAKTIFGKWSIEIFIVLHNLGPLGFEQLRKHLGGITPRVLSQRLKGLEGQGLVQRTLVQSRPPGVRYALTARGSTVARLGEPVFLFLGLVEQQP